MALDKVVDSATLDADLLAVADAIRAKVGTSETLTFPNGFVEAIQAISAGGGAEGIYTGTYVSAERVNESIFFNAPGATNFAMFIQDGPDLTTGVAFFTSICGCQNGVFTSCGSNNSGTAATYSINKPVGTEGNDLIYFPGLSFSDDGVNIIYNPYGVLNNVKLPQVGATYCWIAW